MVIIEESKEPIIRLNNIENKPLKIGLFFEPSIYLKDKI